MVNLFIFGCAESTLLLVLFSGFREWGLLSRCRGLLVAAASHVFQQLLMFCSKGSRVCGLQ